MAHLGLIPEHRARSHPCAQLSLLTLTLFPSSSPLPFSHSFVKYYQVEFLTSGQIFPTVCLTALIPSLNTYRMKYLSLLMLCFFATTSYFRYASAFHHFLAVRYRSKEEEDPPFSLVSNFSLFLSLNPHFSFLTVISTNLNSGVWMNW